MQYTVVFDVLRGDSQWWIFPLISALFPTFGIVVFVYFSRHPKALLSKRLVDGAGEANAYDGTSWSDGEQPVSRRLKEKRKARYALFKILFLALWTFGSLIFAFVVLFMTVQQERRFRARLKTGDFEVVEGIVTNFKPEPPRGHSDEEFDVSGHHYSLSSAASTGGYHKTLPHGGSIREGLLVRIADVNGVILKLEVAKGPVPLTNPFEIAAVRDTLLRMGIEDQDGRTRLAQAIVKQDSAILSSMMRGDSVRSRWLRIHVARAGWPLRSIVGDSAAGAAWLILQHSPFLDLQREMLPKLENLAKQKEVNPSEIALLKDRVLKNQNLPQEYGTQFDMKDGKLVAAPIKDLPQLDARRATVGLPPMKEHVRVMQEMYNAPVVWPPE